MYEIKCKSCQLVLGESENVSSGQAEISCIYCIDERNEFRGIFGNAPEDIGLAYDNYWDAIRRWNNWMDRPFYLHETRELKMVELIAFFYRLKRTCEVKENES